jgi:hypothetical protein
VIRERIIRRQQLKRTMEAKAEDREENRVAIIREGKFELSVEIVMGDSNGCFLHMLVLLLHKLFQDIERMFFYQLIQNLAFNQQFIIKSCSHAIATFLPGLHHRM